MLEVFKEADQNGDGLLTKVNKTPFRTNARAYGRGGINFSMGREWGKEWVEVWGRMEGMGQGMSPGMDRGMGQGENCGKN